MSCINLWIILFFFFTFVPSEAQDDSDLERINCTDSPIYAPNSTYRRHLDLLLSSLSSNATSSGFRNLTVGRNSSDAVYGLYLCRGDVSGDACAECVEYACREIVNRCPNQETAIMWTAKCMLRYSNQSIFSSVQLSPWVYFYIDTNVTHPESFMEILGNTLDDLVARAAVAGEKFATKEARVTSLQTLYSLAQCTPDLSADDCNRCLRDAVSELPERYYGNQGVRAMFPSCTVNYESGPFYQIATAPPPPPIPISPLPLPSPPPNPSRGPTGKKVSTRIVLITVASTATCVVLCVLGYFLLLIRLRKQRDAPEDLCTEVGHITNFRSLQFKLSAIEAATNNFNADNKLGQGGFGPVYKGTLPDGQEIAVKKLSNNSGQGAKEFRNEVMVLAKLQHRNLVRLLGFCLERKEKLLVYEYVCNKSLDCFLYDPVKKELLDWPTRRKIALDIARGVLYLHEDSRLTIIHCDLKTSNILLDENLNVKIADFGIARIFNGTETHDRTRNIVGTCGYMAPEYRMRGQFSVKSDVFSFGVILLEIITGKKNNSIFETDGAENLLSYVWKHWSEGTPLELMDPSLGNTCSEKEVIRCIHVGLLCVQENAKDRPVMSSVLLMLNRYFALPSPQRPAFLLCSKTDWNLQTESTHSTDGSALFSVNNLTITELYPRE